MRFDRSKSGKKYMIVKKWYFLLLLVTTVFANASHKHEEDPALKDCSSYEVAQRYVDEIQTNKVAFSRQEKVLLVSRFITVARGNTHNTSVAMRHDLVPLFTQWLEHITGMPEQAQHYLVLLHEVQQITQHLPQIQEGETGFDSSQNTNNNRIEGLLTTKHNEISHIEDTLGLSKPKSRQWEFFASCFMVEVPSRMEKGIDNWRNNTRNGRLRCRHSYGNNTKKQHQ